MSQKAAYLFHCIWKSLFKSANQKRKHIIVISVCRLRYWYLDLMVFTKWYICISSSLAILLKYNVFCRHDDYGIPSFANVSVFNKHLVQLYCIVSVWNAFSVLFLFWNVMRMIYYYLIVLLQEFERKQICFRIYVDPMIIH